jgi:probable addiction module antidote protein
MMGPAKPAHMPLERDTLRRFAQAIMDPDQRVFLIALRDVAQSWGGMTKISRASKIPRISLYKILSKNGNPEIHTLQTLLKVFKLSLQIAPLHPLKKAA